MAKQHLITMNDGEVEECFCSEGRDHKEAEGDWDLFGDDDEDGDF